jgi:hypothetical protein
VPANAKAISYALSKVRSRLMEGTGRISAPSQDFCNFLKISVTILVVRFLYY